MVVESLINPIAAKKNPLAACLLGGLYASLGLFLSYWVFTEYSSLIMVFLITLAAVPLLYLTTRAEEETDMHETESVAMKEHTRVMLFLMFLFVGMTFALTILYIFLPSHMVSTLFSTQTQTINTVNNHISGGIAQTNIFAAILMNNLRVLMFSILFSFLYGMGSIFILTWNASMIAAVVGNFIRKNLAIYSGAIGVDKVNAYLGIFSFGFFRYLLHGIPEILAYVIGGLAGGIISMACMRRDMFSAQKDRIIFDATLLFSIAIILLILAAFLEVYITPVITNV